MSVWYEHEIRNFVLFISLSMTVKKFKNTAGHTITLVLGLNNNEDINTACDIIKYFEGMKNIFFPKGLMFVYLSL